MATVTALYMALSSVGSAIGASISGSLWTQKMYHLILENINDPKLAYAAYSDPYTFIQSYVWGTPEREAVVNAYKAVQRLIMIVALALTVPFFICVFFCKDRYLTSDLATEQEGNIEKRSDDPIWDWAMSILRIRNKKKAEAGHSTEDIVELQV